MRKIHFLLAAVAIAAMTLAGGVLRATPESGSGTAIGGKAPDFTLQDQNGKNVSLHDLAGKIIVLEWTNPKCPFVQRVYRSKTMLTTYGQFKARDVAWLAINSSNFATNKDNGQWATDQAIPYSILNDSAGTVGKMFHATNTPEMYVIGKDGTLLYKGAIDNDRDGDKTTDKVNYVNQALDEIFAGKQVSVSETEPYGCSVKYQD